MIVQELHKIQHDHGYLPEKALHELARRLQTPLYRLQEVASFFPHFKLKPGAKIEILVCHDMACHLAGAAQVREQLKRTFGPGSAEEVEVKFTSCLGRCDRAIAATVNDKIYVQQTADKLTTVAREMVAGRKPASDLDSGFPRQSAEPWKIDPYNGKPTYDAVRQFLETGSNDGVLEQLKIADLRGMGGAGVPAHQKWSDLIRARGDEKYIVCNGDESEPTTFKDRELLLRAPHLVLEGMILAGLMSRAKKGYVYIRHEYPEEIDVVRKAIRHAESMGACGRNIFGSERTFPLEVFVSPGGYICGEQSALIEAMEDRRAQPRNKPPQLETNGLYDKPTVVSNVETFSWVPSIMIHGGAWYRDAGRPGCKGMRFFSLCGDVKKPGAYEVPCGITLGELINNNEFGGGMTGGFPLKAFAPSGPSGGFLPAKLPLKDLPRNWEKKLPSWFVDRVKLTGGDMLNLLDIPLDLQCMRDLGLAIGAGMMVYAEGTNMLDHALNCTEFFRTESCGKCVPCRLGSDKLVQMAQWYRSRQGTKAQQDAAKPVVDELGRVMELTSICGLGAIAAKPLTSVLKYFPQDVATYASDNRRR